MIRKDILDHIVSFIVYVVLQLFLINKLVLFDQAFSFFYIGFLLLLPQNTGKIYLLLWGMGTGLLIDMFFDTVGVHAAASVLIMFLRPFWLSTTTGGKLEEDEKLNLRNLGFTSFVTYLLPLALVHHIMVFAIEGYGFARFYMILMKSVTSSLFTLAVIGVIQLFTTSPNRRRI